MITHQDAPLALTKKLAVVLNEKLEAGVAMNALAHMALGMGARLGPADSLMCDYRDADGISHPFISAYPFIVLKGRPTKIREAIEAAKNENTVQIVNFTSSMTVGTYVDQLERTHALPSAELDYYGAVFFGDVDAVNALTKKFSLYK